MRYLVIAIVLATAVVAHAQPADVPALIKLVDNQPADMDRPTWKEKRRDAARKLAQSKDKRAVPVLIRLADTETFDIIGEIAIEGLGTLGDPSAVPTLQKIVGDPSRDKSQRDLARKSLAKLGASETPTGGGDKGGGDKGGGDKGGGDKGGGDKGGGDKGGGDKGGGAGVIGTGDLGKGDNGGGDKGTGGGGETGGGGAGLLLGQKSPSELPPLPELDDDTLSAYDRLTFVAGSSSLSYSTGRDSNGASGGQLEFAADLAGSYAKRVERERMAWGFDADAHVVAGWINPPGRGSSRGTEIVAHGDGEARFYSGQIYGVGKLATAIQLDNISATDANDPNRDVHLSTTEADLQAAIGAGFGRLLDIGAAIRVRRLSRALDANRALGKPIDAATSKRLQLTWWALRGERSAYRALVATVAILREAGILLGEPDAGITYEILNVLRDTQLFVRPSGYDVQVAVGEGYLRRPQGAIDNGVENGRVEQLLASAGYGAQLDDDKLELSGTAYGRLRILADMGQPSPWAAGATARITRFTYGEHGDPFGALDLAGTVQVSSDDQMMSDKALRIAGELGFTYWMNQASGLRLAAQVADDQGTFFVGANLQATYGLLDGTFAK